MAYKIIMDVSGDIDLSVTANKEVDYLRMEYSLGDDMRICICPEDRDMLHTFYDGQRGGDLTKTSQITPFLYEKYITPYLENGTSVLYLCLSSGLSSTYSSAQLAQASLKETYPDVDFLPVDSLAATGGMGLLAERALRNQAAGMSIEDNYKDLVEATHKIRHWFLVRDLMYLKRGGRVSATTAVVGTALNITPILCINPQGKLDTIAKKRGAKGAAKYLLGKLQETYDPEAGDVIYVIDADDQDMGDYLEQEVQKLYPEAVIRRSGLSPIIGAHTGPNMAAIIHMGR